MHNLKGYLLFIQIQVLLIRKVSFLPNFITGHFRLYGISIDNNKLLLKYVRSIQVEKKHGLSIVFIFNMENKISMYFLIKVKLLLLFW